MEESEERGFPTHPSALAEIRRWVRERAAEAGLSVKTTEELALAVNEAAANALVHSGSADIVVRWTRREGEVVLEVRDQGVFKRRVRLPQIEGPGGYGIQLMMSLMDQVEISEGTARYPGTAVRLVKRKHG
ncbi:MAG TPA: ATP-binding protein [Actinomycetota bacterium]|nr:ATP-binding protein [Actinomycetota bacterium]